MSQSQKTKRLFIKTWGCQMNVYDSARMADILAPLGYALAENPALADLVVFNTCHIREKASEKLFSELGRLMKSQKARRERGEKPLIAVAGCVAQAAAEEIKRRAPFVDLIFGPQTYHRLPELLVRAAREKGSVLDVDFPSEPKFDSFPEAQGGIGISAFLAIQEGCDRFCSYCVVPYTRGAEYSRDFEAITREAEKLGQAGAKEITLLGQNVNAYRDEASGRGLAALIERIALIPGILRLRYTTSHPLSMTDDLIEAHRDIPKLMPFLHLPIQSGADNILDAMNRKHKAAEYLRIIEKLRAARGDLALSSDFIVGFPGETDADFEATMRLAHEVGYAQAFSFKYSRRPGTPAAAMKEQVPEDVKEDRLARLQALLREQQTAFNKSCVGRHMPVLFENLSEKEGHVFGRSPYLHAVRVPGGESLIGAEHAVTIEKAYPNSLEGGLKEEAAL